MVEYVLLLPREHAVTVNKRVFGLPLLARVVYRLEDDETNRVTLVGNLPASELCTALGSYPREAELSLRQDLGTGYSPRADTNTVIFWDATLIAAKELPDLISKACNAQDVPMDAVNIQGQPIGAMAVPAPMFKSGLGLEGIRNVADLRTRITEFEDTEIEEFTFEGYAESQSVNGRKGNLKKQLLNELKKPVAVDGPSAAYLQRPIALILTRMIAWSPIRPNHATAMALVIGLVGALCMASGSKIGFVVGGSLMLLGAIVDCVDGNLARLKDQGSYAGAWFDTITDDICNLAFLMGTGVGLYRATGEISLMFLGVGSALIIIPGILFQYRTLHSMRLADVCDYPWLFEDKNIEKEPTPLGTSLKYLKFLVKRDTYIMACLALILFGYTWMIPMISFTGGLIFEIILVMDLRKRRALEHPPNIDSSLVAHQHS